MAKHRELLLDWLPALLLAPVAVYDAGSYAGSGRAALVAAALGATLPVGLRRQRPLPAYLLVSGSLAVIALAFPAYESVAVLFSLMIGTYALAQREDTVPALLGASTGLVAVAASIARDPTDELANVPPSVLLFVGLPWVAGWAVRRRQLRADHLADEATHAAASERERIARELHDIVAHAVTVMVVQAQAAQRLAQTDPTGELEALEAIEQSGRQALVELRRLLGVLRADDEEEQRRPQPGIPQLEGLADDMRLAGLPVSLEIDGDTGLVPASVGVSAYRIVQEALTNTFKHAGPVTTRVVVRARPDALEVEVVDHGDTARADGAGYGLIGIRERVRLHGGTLAAGRRPEGGFLVHAEIPL